MVQKKIVKKIIKRIPAKTAGASPVKKQKLAEEPYCAPANLPANYAWTQLDARLKNKHAKLFFNVMTAETDVGSEDVQLTLAINNHLWSKTVGTALAKQAKGAIAAAACRTFGLDPHDFSKFSFAPLLAGPGPVALLSKWKGGVEFSVKSQNLTPVDGKMAHPKHEVTLKVGGKVWKQRLTVANLLDVSKARDDLALEYLQHEDNVEDFLLSLTGHKIADIKVPVKAPTTPKSDAPKKPKGEATPKTAVSRVYEYSMLIGEKLEFEFSEHEDKGQLEKYGARFELKGISAETYSSSKKSAKVLASETWLKQFEEENGDFGEALDSIRLERKKAPQVKVV